MGISDADIDAIIGKGLEHYGRGELDVAIGLWQRALESDPENREAREYIDYVSANFDDIEEQFVGGGNAFAIEFAGEPGFPLEDEATMSTARGAPLGPVDPLDGDTAEDLDSGWFLESAGDAGQDEIVTSHDDDDDVATGVLGVDDAGAGDNDTATTVLPKRDSDEETAPTVAFGLGARLGPRDSDNETAPTVSMPGFPRPSKDDQTAPTLALGGRRPLARPSSPDESNPMASLDLSDMELAPSGTGILTEEAAADELVLTMADPSESGTIDLDDAPPVQQAKDRPVSFDDIELDSPIVALTPESKKGEGQVAQSIERALDDIEDGDIGFEASADSDDGADIEAPTMQVTRQRLELSLEDDDDDELDLDPPTRQRSRSRMLTPPPVGDAMSMEAIAQQIMEEVDAGAGDAETADQAIERRVSRLIDKAIEHRGQSHTVAVVAADLALNEAPAAAVAQKLIHDRERELVALFRDHIGELGAVPQLSVSLEELMSSELDNRAAFLASRVDGVLTFDELIDVSAMPRLEAHRYLSRLLLQGILQVFFE